MWCASGIYGQPWLLLASKSDSVRLNVFKYQRVLVKQMFVKRNRIVVGRKIFTRFSQKAFVV